MAFSYKSKHTSVPPWVTDPSILSIDVKPPVIAAVSRINARAPPHDTWWAGSMSTDDRASYIISELGGADLFQKNLCDLLRPHVVRESTRHGGSVDNLSQHDNSCHSVASTTGIVAGVLARCEKHERHRLSLLSRSLARVRGAVCERGGGKKGIQNWVLRPELLSADLEPAVTQAIRDLNGKVGAEARAWAAPLTTRQRLDLVQQHLARRLGDEVAAATSERRTARMLGQIFAPHQVRDVKPRLQKALLQVYDRHQHPEHKLVEVFWMEVRRSLLGVMRECEELSQKPGCRLPGIRWWNERFHYGPKIAQHLHFFDIYTTNSGGP